MGCCSNGGSTKYQFDNKTRTISKKNQETLEKYGAGAAARNYTKNMKLNAISDITCEYFFHKTIISSFYFLLQL